MTEMPTTTTAPQLSDFMARSHNEAVYASATEHLTVEFNDFRNRILSMSVDAMEAVCDLFTVLEPAGDVQVLETTINTIDIEAIESANRDSFDFFVANDAVVAETRKVLEFAGAQAA